MVARVHKAATVGRGVILIALVVLASSANAADRPNIVMLLVDDLGYGDLGCFGNTTVKTPNIDRLASEGIRFTACYSAGANCSPSRAGLMTGRTPYRVGVYNHIFTYSPMHLRREEITLPKILKQHGYATCQVGKWHLNGRLGQPDQPQPSDHGFDHYFATQNNALPNHHDPDNFVRDGTPLGKLTGYSSAIVAQEAIRWLNEERDRQKPFFLYVCFHEPHEPIATAPEYSQQYGQFAPAKAARFGNVAQLDAAVGRILAALDSAALRDDTLVFFTSDNGPEMACPHPYGSAGPLRESKGWLYEGGIRVPGMVRWPGHVAAGRTVDEPIVGTDILPTVCDLLEISPPSDRKLDGVSIAPLLEGKPWRRERPIFWWFNRAKPEPRMALRDGDWKIVARFDRQLPAAGASITAAEMEFLKSAEPAGFELYNLREDIGERNDRAASEPRKLAELTAKLKAYHADVRSENPVWPAFTDPGYERVRIIYETSDAIDRMKK